MQSKPRNDTEGIIKILAFTTKSWYNPQRLNFGRSTLNLIYGVKDKPRFHQLLIFAFQQVLAILAATIACALILGIVTNLLLSRGKEE